MSDVAAQVSIRVDRLLKLYLGADIELRSSTTAADIKKWDSLTHVKILLALEEEFGFSFSNREVMKLENVGQLIDLVTAKLPRA